VPRPILIPILLAVTVFGQKNSDTRIAWNKPVPPFHIIGNIYYVGVAGVSSFLIVTPQGDILLDGGLPESAPLIEKSIATLGFRIADVKYLLNSHAHFDHAGGLAELRRASGAKLIASRGDTPVLTTGKQVGFPDSFPVHVDRVIDDGATVELGGVVLTAHLTPGHTKGCTTWTMPVTDSGKTYNVLFYCSTSVVDRLVHNARYPGIVADYEASFRKLRTLPCDVFLGPHGEFFHLEEKRQRLAAGGPNPFIDPAEFPAYVDQSERDFRATLAREQK
jgi:metallo-beta-lactamase class B